MDNTANFSQLCRLCVQNKDYMKNIFSSDFDLIEFNVKLYCCVPSIKIDEPTLPSLICHSCIKKLRYAFAFRQQCIDSTRILINKYQSAHCVNICDDDAEMVECSDSQPDIKEEIVENLEDSSNHASRIVVPSGTGNQTNVQIKSCRINKETCRIFTDLARLGIESSKLRIESLKSKIQSLKENELVTKRTSGPQNTSESKIEEPTISSIQDEEATPQLSEHVEEMSSEFNHSSDTVLEAILSSNLEELPSSFEDVSPRSSKAFDDASLMFEDETSNASDIDESLRIEEDQSSVDEEIAEDSENDSSRIDAFTEPTGEDSSKMEELAAEVISTRVTVEDESSITTDRPIIEDLARFGEEPTEVLITPRIEEDLQIEVPDTSQIEESSRIERNSDIETTQCTDLEAIISNAFKALHPTENQLITEQTDAVDDLINMNIVEDLYENRHDHTYSKHYDKQFEEQMTIKIEGADVNLEANEKMNVSLHLETANNKENVEETIMDIQNNILEPLVEISNSEETEVTTNTNFPMEKREVGNFIAKKCEKLKNDHELESPYICTSCDRGFNTINKLRIHLRTHITKAKELCQKCGSNITTRKTHRCCNSTEHNCSFCARKFKSAAGLFKHKYHKHIKGYVCSFCAERFTDTRTLNKHLKTHAEDFNNIAVP